MKNKKRIGALFASVLIAIIFFYSQVSDSDMVNGVSATRQYLEKLEKQDVKKVENEINKKNGYTSDGFDIKRASKFYENTVFMGDSITEYLSELDILSDSSVIAHKGDTVAKGLEKVNTLKSLQPDYIVLFYGMNDSLSFTPDIYKSRYIKLVKDIKKEVPKAKVIIQEPLSVYEPLSTARDPKMTNARLNEFKDAAKEVADETGVTFLESSNLITSTKLYEGDGVHLKYDFYKNWLAYLSSNLE